MLAKLTEVVSKDTKLYAPGERIYGDSFLYIIMNPGKVLLFSIRANDVNSVKVKNSCPKVGINGVIMSMYDSWGEDFILMNPRLRREVMAAILTFTEVQLVSSELLFQVLKTFKSEASLLHPRNVLVLISLAQYFKGNRQPCPCSHGAHSIHAHFGSKYRGAWNQGSPDGASNRGKRFFEEKRATCLF